MKIRKIKSIKNYKSFFNFAWSDFCKDRAGTEKIFSNFNLVFGENGAGKSSICEILKNFSGNQDFQGPQPVITELEVENGNNQIFKFENGNWTPSRPEKCSFLFFDVDFISANVHTHGDRSNQQGRHSQNSGKMIIDLDDKANQLKIGIQEKKDEMENFEKTNYVILNKLFSNEDKQLFFAYKDKTEQEVNNEIVSTKDSFKKIEAELLSLQNINKKYFQIGQISLINHLSVDLRISKKEMYEEIFCRQIKEKSQDQADEKIKNHFEKHKRFIDLAKGEIAQDYKDENCPLCMQPLANASEFIEYYRMAFDQTYEKEKGKFLSDIESFKKELRVLKLSFEALPLRLSGIFDSFERIKNDFEIDIYDLKEKNEYVGSSDLLIPEIDELILALDALKAIDRKDFDCSMTYNALLVKIEDVRNKMGIVNQLIDNKNKIISSFKDKYSNRVKITDEIQEKIKKLNTVKDLDCFLNGGKIVDIKSQIEAQKQQKRLAEELKKSQEELKNHLANTIPEDVIKKMIDILGKFNLNFSIEHVKSAQNTKDYSFSFKIKDQKGNERNFKDGLSEGERQLISLAFFFAINEKVQDKANTILIFDDPITSLDSPNLKILAEFIHERIKEFSQVMIFTHHPLFHKYLAKCENPNACKFGVLKNHEVLGGSFIFFDPGFDLTAEIKGCDQEIKECAKNGNLKPEEIALKYGQLLRLAVEKFIKHDLLL
jgi:DNA repair exonuclease SbcCD ATPase subunit